jgi:hypothetical protein
MALEMCDERKVRRRGWDGRLGEKAGWRFEMKYWLKACPRCHGDLEQEQDQFGPYVSCVQCGYILRAEEESALLMRRVTLPAGPVKKAA